MIWFLRSLGQKRTTDKGVFMGKRKRNGKLKDVVFSAAVSLQISRRQRQVYMPLNHKSSYKIFSFCVQFPSLPPPPPSMTPDHPSNASEGTAPAQPQHTRTAHGRTRIIHLLHRYSFQFLLLSFTHQKGVGNDNTKAFSSYCAWELEYSLGGTTRLNYNEQCWRKDRRRRA